MSDHRTRQLRSVQGLPSLRPLLRGRSAPATGRSLGMFPLLRTRSRRRRTRFVLIARPTPETIAGLVTAGAIMACADGRIDPAERRAWLAFLREQGLLAQ